MHIIHIFEIRCIVNFIITSKAKFLNVNMQSLPKFLNEITDWVSNGDSGLI
jgi:regulator of sigma D